MKNLNYLLNQPLTWTINKKQTILQSDAETIIELTEDRNAKVFFMFDGKKYTIQNKGFGYVHIILERYGEQMVIMKIKFPGSNGTIKLKNENLYSCKITNTPVVKLSFFNGDEKEILYYKLDATENPKPILNIVDHSINEYDLLMLIILGCYSFMGIVKENEQH